MAEMDISRAMVFREYAKIKKVTGKMIIAEYMLTTQDIENVINEKVNS